METRYGVVDAAFKAAIPITDSEQVLSDWGYLLKAINRSKNVRNLAAHGLIGTATTRDGTNHIRLMPPLFNFQRIAPSVLKGQLPGMSANDLQQSMIKVSRAGTAIDLFSKWLDAARKGDSQSLQKILAQLETDLQNLDPQSASQIGPKRKRRPPASEA